ncbi:Response regulator receiver domain-containing protein [Cohaesibacter sp. ES.047]|uniref:hybrid sensor histidine kinase/response regulator n=1 Tax=Cohaesibacter sp. ES.047 TaxID=1798205 RepID=UPI000BB7319E|nr:hybrid sensor histidine kinase/response regulator [Cohaesibacter sp. ES.047]SNY90827.1 Response regulator receiver domain-containing protein [Cohaesibacter sp. ES.047]
MVEKTDTFQHDLRTHLSAIISLTDLVKTTTDPEMSASLLDAILIAAGNAMTMLDGSAPVLGAPAHRPGMTSRTLQDFGKLATSLCKTKGIVFHLDIEEAVTAIPCPIAEPAHLHRALILLLDNALKYAKGSDITLKAARTDDKTLTLTFSDEGEGFGTTDPELLFEPYHRGVNPANVSGSGLGLWSVRNLIRATGGDIRAEKNAPRGACFRIWLPIIDFDEDNPITTPGTDFSSQERPEGWEMRILVVDDNQTNHLILDQLLKALGTAPIHATSGEEALGVLGAEPLDLAFIDIRMANMDGWELARHIRADQSLSGLPLIAISADAAPEQIVPFDHWLQRPIEPARLYDLLTRMAGTAARPQIA